MSKESPMILILFRFNLTVVFNANIKASYSALLLVQGNFNLNKYGIGIPWGVMNTTPALPPYSHREPSNCIIISQLSLGSTGISSSSNWNTPSLGNSMKRGLSSCNEASAR